MTSLLPSRLTAMSSRVPQSETHKRPECHLGDSPNLRLVSRSCGLGLLPIVYSLLKGMFTHNTSIVSEFVTSTPPTFLALISHFQTLSSFAHRHLHIELLEFFSFNS